jgi:D-3-phosphoglycerate dehydrogenase
MPKMTGQYRLTIAHENIPNIIGPITNAIAKVDVNIIDMLNKSLNEAAYTLIDTEAALPNTVIDEIKAIEGVLNVRCLN